MDFELTGGQRDLVAQTREYAERVVRPAAARLEQLSRAEDFPFDLMREGNVLRAVHGERIGTLVSRFAR